jgi:hypothetical protein
MKEYHDSKLEVKELRLGDIVGVVVPKPDRFQNRSIIPMLIIGVKTGNMYQLRYDPMVLLTSGVLLTMPYRRTANYVLDSWISVEFLISLPKESYPELTALLSKEDSHLEKIPLRTLAQKRLECPIKLSDVRVCNVCQGSLGERSHRCGFCGNFVWL